MTTRFRVSRAALRHAQRRDVRAIADPRNDSPAGIALTDVLIVLSTPRSGSSYACEMFHAAGLGEGREYFNPALGVPVLASRWGCLRCGIVDFVALGQALARKRIAASGWLAIKVHASHLNYFQAALPAFDGARLHWVLIRRRDTLAQAVSLSIARQTRQWSSLLEAATDDVRYSYRDISLCLRRIEAWNHVLEAFARTCAETVLDYVYEDFLRNTETELRRLPVLANAALDLNNLGIARQANARNAEWIRRYRAEMLDREEHRNRGVARRLLIEARRRLGSLIWG